MSCCNLLSTWLSFPLLCVSFRMLCTCTVLVIWLYAKKRQRDKWQKYSTNFLILYSVNVCQRKPLANFSSKFFVSKALANSCLYALFMSQAIIKIWQWFTVSQDFLHNSDQFFKSFIVRCNWQVKLADWLSRKIQQRVTYVSKPYVFTQAYVFIYIWQWFSDSLLKFGSDLWRFSFSKHSHHTAV